MARNELTARTIKPNVRKDSYVSRVSGGGNTVVSVNGHELAFCQSISDTPPTLHTKPVEIQGIDDLHPIAIVPPTGSHGAGSLSLVVKEVWDSRAWEQLGIEITGSTTGSNTKYDMFQALFTSRTQVKVERVIKNHNKSFTRTYNNCIITAVNEADTNVQLNTSAPDVTVTLMYTHYTDIYL